MRQVGVYSFSRLTEKDIDITFSVTKEIDGCIEVAVVCKGICLSGCRIESVNRCFL